MYHGKHSKRSDKRSVKSTVFVVSILLVLCLTVGGTIAFLIASSGPIKNIFNSSTVTTVVNETLAGTTKSDVSISNTGDTDAWIRAAVVVTWQDAQGNVYGQAPKAGDNYTKWTPGNDWVEGNDGFYYYTKPVVAGDSTATALINSIAPVGVSPAEGYYLNVEIIGSGIQSKPANAFNSAWASSGLSVKTVDESGNELPPEQWTLSKQGGAGA